MNRKLSVLMAALAVGFLCRAAAAQPVITSLSATSLTRSGRLLVQGSGFGTTQGTSHVEIGGLTAPVTRWSDTLIAAYVPEATSTGIVSVQVFAGGSASNMLPLTVTLRQPNGQVKWRFQADSDYIFQRPAVGPDGTIVAHDSAGFVYALTPNGGLKWIFKTPLFAYGPPSVGVDGTVYVASSSTIYAINSDGTLKWSFTEPAGGQGVVVGPTVGPDGNIYAVTDFGGLGALSLSPTGKLLWSNPGDPAFNQLGQLGAEVVFGPSHTGGMVDQFYVANDDATTDPRSHLYAFHLSGDQVWAIPMYLSKDSFLQGQQQPAVGPDGTVFESAAIPTGGNWALNTFDPAKGTLNGSFFPSPGNGMSAPDIGTDGSAYFIQSLSYLQSVNAAGSLRWQYFDGSILSYPIVSPANTIVVTGGAPNFGMPGFVRGFSTTNGQLLWSVDLGIENGGNQVMQSRPRFAADGSVVYFGTVLAGASSNDTYCYLYALDTGTATSVPVLSSISPGVADAGGPSFTLTVKGSAFATNSVVNWNSTALSTTYVSSKQLKASVPGSLIANPGTAKVTVTTPGAGTSVAKTFTIRVTTLKLAAAIVSKDNTTGVYTASITLKNIGFNTASSVSITASSLGSTKTSASLPLNVGSIAAGATITNSLSFPAAAGTSGTVVTLKASGTFTGGKFSGSLKVTLP